MFQRVKPIAAHNLRSWSPEGSPIPTEKVVIFSMSIRSSFPSHVASFAVRQYASSGHHRKWIPRGSHYRNIFY